MRTKSKACYRANARLVTLPEHRRPRLTHQKIQIRSRIRPEHMIDVELPVAAVERRIERRLLNPIRYDRPDLGVQRRQIPFNRVPDDADIHFEVPMHQHVAHFEGERQW